MSPFPSPLVTRILAPSELVDGTQLYSLTEDFSYDSALLGPITVPNGFTTDFASIPRVAWRYIDPEDPCILFPSVIHDYLYSLMGLLPDGREYSREQADSVLREAMAICGARFDQKAVVYRMVRLFGGSHWNSP